jgi:hypothetical protein
VLVILVRGIEQFETSAALMAAPSEAVYGWKALEPPADVRAGST